MEYLQIHDRVEQYIHWKICQHYNAPYAKNWYKHKQQKVVETESATVLRDFPFHTGGRIQENKPYTAIKDHKEKNMQNN